MITVTSGNVIHATDLDQVIKWLIGTTPSDATVTAVPIGSITMFAGPGPTAPAGWTFCDGSAISRTIYANLFAVLASTYGAGDGTTTFNVPDMRSRSPVGVGIGAGLTNRVLAATGGEEAHSLAQAENATHNHGNTGTESYNHYHGVSWQTASGYGGGTSYVTSAGSFLVGSYGNNTLGQSGSHYHGINNDGSGTAHNTMHPFLAVNFIIKL